MKSITFLEEKFDFIDTEGNLYTSNEIDKMTRKAYSKYVKEAKEVTLTYDDMYNEVTKEIFGLHSVLKELKDMLYESTVETETLEFDDEL